MAPGGIPCRRPETGLRRPVGLLRRKLTEDEVRKIATDLADQARGNGDPITAQDVEQMINDAFLQEASAEDVVRVSAHLAAGGWPLADPPLD